ncbi:hypothetical protein EMCRGX_G019997 [Ephydatia muelleri]|eukprot:Em0011g21a
MKKYPELSADLSGLNEKLSNLVKSEVGQFIGELYEEHLKKCMIILRQDLMEQSGTILLEKLSDIWSQFYTSILPTLQVIFAPIQLRGQSIRSITLISFTDILLLKTGFADAIKGVKEVQPELKQMLLVLQSIHRNPPTEHYYTLQSLVKQVVHPYMCLVTSPKLKQPQDLDESSASLQQVNEERNAVPWSHSTDNSGLEANMT